MLEIHRSQPCVYIWAPFQGQNYIYYSISVCQSPKNVKTYVELKKKKNFFWGGQFLVFVKQFWGDLKTSAVKKKYT
jgi:hypothetical protein